MTAPDPAPIPAGHEGMIAHLVVSNGADAIEFYKKAFGAQEIFRTPGPGGKLMYAEIRIDGRPIYLNDDFPEFNDGKARAADTLGGSPVTLHRYVEDCDAAIQRAVDAGATLSMPPQDMFWGDRYGIVQDPFGHVWSLATHIKDVSPDELAAAAAGAFCGE